jgi:flagellar protein FliJ
VSAPRHDRGLRAVARVRGVREHDSRLGLQLALAEQRTRDERVTTLAGRLAHAPAALSGSPADIVGLRAGLDALGDALRGARTDAEAQRLLTDDARARWQAAATELEAVEQLLDRRAARRRAAAAKAEAKELDDLASVRWAREAAR